MWLSVSGVSDVVAWDGRDQSLFVADDAGRTWERQKLPVQSGEQVATIRFMNRSVGWVIVESGKTGANRNTSFRLLYTGTSGDSSQEVAAQAHSGFTVASLDAEGELWVA